MVILEIYSVVLLMIQVLNLLYYGTRCIFYAHGTNHKDVLIATAGWAILWPITIPLFIVYHVGKSTRQLYVDRNED